MLAKLKYHCRTWLSTGNKELFLDLLLDHHGNGEFLDGCIIEADVLLVGCSIGTSSMDGNCSGMCRDLECNASNNNVFGDQQDEAKVSMAASTLCGRDGMGIGIDLLGQ